MRARKSPHFLLSNSMSSYNQKFNSAAAMSLNRSVQRQANSLKPSQNLNNVTRKTQIAARQQNSRPNNPKSLNTPTLRQQTPDTILTQKGKMSLSQNSVADASVNSQFRARINQVNAILSSNSSQNKI